MARIRHQVNDFTAGELSPLLDMRSDLDHYHRGARSLENVIVTPHGGVRRRSGLKFIEDVGGQGGIANARPFGFLFGDDQAYLIVLLDQAIRIYKDDVFFEALTMTSDTSPVAIPWTSAELIDLRVAQQADTMIIVHEDHPPHRLVRNTSGAPEAFELYDLTKNTADQPRLKNIPLFNFDDSNSPAAGLIEEVQRISFIAGWSVGDKFRLKLDNIKTGWMTFEDDREDMAQTMANAMNFIPFKQGFGVEVKVDPNATPTEDFFYVTFQATLDKNGELEETENKNDIIFEPGKSALGTFSVVEVTPGATTLEPVWSDVYDDASSPGRGWPRSVCFHAGRMWFGGSRSRPSTIWGSRAGARFFNFDLGDAVDSDAIASTIDANEINVVQHLTSSRTMVVSTKSSEYVVETEDTTPKDIRFRLQTTHGANGVTPINIDGATLWVDHAERSIREFLFDFQTNQFQGNEISILAQHLINAPRDMALHRIGDGDYIYICNGNGNVAVLNVNRAQGVKAFSRLTSAQGQFFRVARVDEDIYFIVLRTINGLVKTHIEKLDSTRLTDASEVLIGNGNQTTWTGLTRFANTVVDLIGDGVFLGQQTVTAGGQVTTIESDIVSLEVGLPYNVVVTPMPFAPPSASDAAPLLAYKAIPKVSVLLRESLDVSVNGDPIPPRAFPAPIGAGPPLIDGPFDIFRTGWERLPEIVITQDAPGPFVLLGVSADVEISTK